MKNTETYNGWTNRETWVVQVHDFFDYEYVRETLQDAEIPVPESDSLGETLLFGDQLRMTIMHWLADWMEEQHDQFIEEQNLNSYVADLLGDHRIDWLELASSYDEEILDKIKSISGGVSYAFRKYYIDKNPARPPSGQDIINEKIRIANERGAVYTPPEEEVKQ